MPSGFSGSTLRGWVRARALVELKLRTRMLDDGEALERLLARSAIVNLDAVRALEAGGG